MERVEQVTGSHNKPTGCSASGHMLWALMKKKKYHYCYIYYVCQVAPLKDLPSLDQQTRKGIILTTPNQLSWHQTPSPNHTVGITISCEMTYSFGPNAPRCSHHTNTTALLLLFSNCMLYNVTHDIRNVDYFCSDSATASQHFRGAPRATETVVTSGTLTVQPFTA
jgi:hypothetical protein